MQGSAKWSSKARSFAPTDTDRKFKHARPDMAPILAARKVPGKGRATRMMAEAGGRGMA